MEHQVKHHVKQQILSSRSRRQRNKQMIKSRRVKHYRVHYRRVVGDTQSSIPIIVRSRLLCCPLQDLEQDVGCCITPSYKVAEVVKVLRSDKLQQLYLHSIASMLWQHSLLHWVLLNWFCPCLEVFVSTHHCLCTCRCMYADSQVRSILCA